MGKTATATGQPFSRWKLNCFGVPDSLLVHLFIRLLQCQTRIMIGLATCWACAEAQRPRCPQFSAAHCCCAQESRIKNQESRIERVECRESQFNTGRALSVSTLCWNASFRFYLWLWFFLHALLSSAVPHLAYPLKSVSWAHAVIVIRGPKPQRPPNVCN